MDLGAILRDERLPAVVVDLDAFDHNVAHAAGIVAPSGLGLRLATKSVRVVALIRRALESGAPYRGLMCFSAEEARFLAGEGFDDLLVAYPTLQRVDLVALRELHEGGTTVWLVVDSADGLCALDAAMATCDRPFPAVLDVDMSLRLAGQHLGVRRSPVRSVDEVLGLFRTGAELAHVRLCGAMGYEAQVAGLPDRNPFKRALNPVAARVRKMSMRQIARRRAEMSTRLADEGFDIELFNGGGTGSLDLTVREQDSLTEVTAGSGLLCSHLFDYYSNVTFRPACFFVLQVVRSSGPGFVTCQGGGYVASGEPGWDKVPVPHDPPGLELVSAEGCGEVQTPLKVPPGTSIALGQPVAFRHAKAGELAERFAEYLLVRGDRIVDRVPTYRGAGQTFFLIRACDPRARVLFLLRGLPRFQE